MSVDFFRGRRGQVQTLEEFYGENDNDWADDDEREAAHREYVAMVREKGLRYNRFNDDGDDGGPGRPQTLDEYNADLERGMAEYARGEYLTSEELKEFMKTW